jgi:hypothetical protein
MCKTLDSLGMGTAILNKEGLAFLTKEIDLQNKLEKM